MAKKKSAPKPAAEVATLWIAHVVTCQWCDETMLIRGGDPRRGDSFQCPRCDSPFEVGDICGDFRDSEEPTVLDVESIG